MFQTMLVFSQDSLLITTDVVSRYILRGQLMGGNSVHIQPKVAFVHKGLEIGVMGTYGITNQYYEVDPYIKYSSKYTSVTFINHFDPILPSDDDKSLVSNVKFFNYGSNTSRIGEVILTYNGPIRLLMSTYIYGNDLDSLSHSRFSTYFELGYTLNIKKQKIDLFFGITPHSGVYANSFAVVNVGVTTYKDIKITEKFTIPTYYTISVNPNTQNIFFIAGLTL